VGVKLLASLNQVIASRPPRWARTRTAGAAAQTAD